MSASEPHPHERGQARSAGRNLLVISGVLASMVLVIIVARLALGGPLSLLSVALPVAGLAWLAGLGVKMLRLDGATELPVAAHERPSRRLRRYEPGLSRSERPSDAGRQVNA